MPNAIDIFAVVVVAVVISILIFDNVRIRSKSRNIATMLIQAEIDKMAIKDMLDKSIKENEITKSDGFIRFLSESRDAAFEYIESAQGTIEEFVNQSEDVINSFADSDTKILYHKLKSLLPKTPNS